VVNLIRVHPRPSAARFSELFRISFGQISELFKDFQASHQLFIGAVANLPLRFGSVHCTALAIGKTTGDVTAGYDRNQERH
jgi:hypothetical protein